MKVSDSEFIQAFDDLVMESGRYPTVRDLCSRTGLTSTSTVHSRMRRLWKNGYLRVAPVRRAS